ncbi:MAG: MaoC family dehydratase [Albidovulum sp.]|nr:MaoC family dehydratase [Albidovulum sp.]MDE0534378.1 MaoC family dehydratase [Albidovulum sp.]
MDNIVIEGTGTIFLEDLRVGMRSRIAKTIGDREIEMFGEIAEDRNPLHFSDEAAKETIFGERIAHGMLTAALFSGLIGEKLPGHGTIYLGQNLRFVAPVKPGDKVVAEVTISEIDSDRNRVNLDCEAWVDDKVVVTGDARVIAPIYN